MEDEEVSSFAAFYVRGSSVGALSRLVGSIPYVVAGSLFAR
jgi:hypothetical protein